MQSLLQFGVDHFGALGVVTVNGVAIFGGCGDGDTLSFLDIQF